MSLTHMEDWTPRGPGGCVRDAALTTSSQTFVVVDGTTIPLARLEALLDFHRASEAALTIVVSPGSPATTKQAPRPTGVYVFDRRVLDCIAEEGFQDIKEMLIPRLYDAGERVVTFAADGECPRVVNAATYLALESWAVERALYVSGPTPGLRMSGQAHIHETARVHPSARLIGPVLVGSGAVVGPRASIVGPASLGAQTTVGAGSVVSRSAVWRQCVVGEGAFVDRCLFTDGAVVGSHKSLFSSLQIGDHAKDARSRGGRARQEPYPWVIPAFEP
jgi:NDP-sugar pyrophosphorylase family protein